MAKPVTTTKRMTRKEMSTLLKSTEGEFRTSRQRDNKVTMSRTWDNSTTLRETYRLARKTITFLFCTGDDLPLQATVRNEESSTIGSIVYTR